MTDAPDLEKITRLLDESKTEKAIRELDKLMSLYARDKNVNAIVDILEMLHLNYLEVHPIQWRLREVYRRLGRRFDDTDL